MFLRNIYPPPLESKLEVSMVHPITSTQLHLLGKVVRIVPHNPENLLEVPGIGIAFEDMSGMRSELLSEFLKDIVILKSSVNF